MFWGEHFSLCLISIYFHQMFETRRFNKRPPFDKIFSRPAVISRRFSEEERGDELCPSPRTPPPLRAFTVNGCSNSESFLQIYIYLIFSGGEAELFVEPLCLPNCLWSSFFFFLSHLLKGPHGSVTHWLPLPGESFWTLLPAEAGCVMNPVVHLFHACYAAQRKMTKSVKRANLTSAATAPCKPSVHTRSQRT